jgi:hypothetical protein
MYMRTLKWPVVSLLLVGGLHFTAEAILPDLKSFFQPPVVAALLLAFGLWVGYRMIQIGGNYGSAILAAVILGILPLVLDIVGFGMILGRGVSQGLLAGVFGFGTIVMGTLIGSGFVLSK